MRLLMVVVFLVINLVIWVLYGVSSLTPAIDAELPATLLEILPYINFFIAINAIASIYFYKVTRQVLHYTPSIWILFILVMIGASYFMHPSHQLSVAEISLQASGVLACFLTICWLPRSSAQVQTA
ncbi:hypothetical protein [Gynurincola endophyticus]|jgi:hypothetical protein|uniref:hypothetical protein n=1 Tax=Gynurincola endophyticus TaxID=2479004 RepID=UPI000F8D92F3|nr:hypothetical protein [Gynurincola endophyticus]